MHCPANARALQCESTGCVYLVDFGFAVASDSSLASRGVAMSKTVGFQGTPLYSAPETFDAVPQVWRGVRSAIIGISLVE